MFFARRPDDDAVRDFLERRRSQTFSYSELGATRDRAPAGYNSDHNRIQLGSGEAAFDRARIAIRCWTMFAMPWISLCWPNTPIEAGATVAVLVSHFGFYSLNAARIVYLIDEPHRYGFAYGTLLDHAEIGEERFLVERNSDGGVWYDLLAFSRPHGLSKIAYPFARRLQRRFARHSMRAMHVAVNLDHSILGGS